MSHTNLSEVPTNHFSYLAKAPGIIFLLVITADGVVDTTKVKQFAKLLKSKDYQILVAAMQQNEASLTQLLTDLQFNALQPLEELRQVCHVLDNYFPKELAFPYKATLLKLAIGIAKSSGGLFDVFGNTISEQQQVAIALIASELGG